MTRCDSAGKFSTMGYGQKWHGICQQGRRIPISFPSPLLAGGKAVMVPGAGAATLDHKCKSNFEDDRTINLEQNLVPTGGEHHIAKAKRQCSPRGIGRRADSRDTEVYFLTSKMHIFCPF